MSETSTTTTTTEATTTAPTSKPTAEDIANSIPDFDPVENLELDQSPEETKQAEPEKKEETKEPAQSLKKKFKLKVDGEEFEEEVDLSNEEYLIKELQLAKAAKKRMTEAYNDKKKAFELTQMFENDIESFLERHPKGKDAAEKLLLKEIQKQMLTPEQLKSMEMEQELARYKQQEQAFKQQQEQAQMQALEQQQAEYYQKTIIDALEKSGLPKTPESAKRMAFLLQKNLELNLDLSAEELAIEAKKEYQAGINNLIKNLSAEQMVQMFGPDILKTLRSYDAQQFKAKNKFQNQVKPSQQETSFQPKEKTYQTLEDWQNELNERMRRK